MLKLFVKRLAVLPAVAAACWTGNDLRAAELPVPARVIKHSATNGQTYSAVVLKASELPKGIIARDHVILIDTSASQVGEYRLQAMGVLDSLLSSLPEGDRVRLFAADLQAEALDDGFSQVRSQALHDSVEALKSRVPLGATNLERALRTAMQSASDRPTDITYIGDGMSTADLLEIPELRSLVSDLRQRQIPVHSFAVGAQRNMQLLGVLAQQTGGFVSFDAPVVEISEPVEARKTKSPKLAREISRVQRDGAVRAAEQGKTLAAALSSPVYFPKTLQVMPAGTSLLPGDALPIRTDRETIYVTQGSLPADARIAMTSADDESLQWKVAAPLEQPAAAFLPVIARQMETTGGLTNALAGMTLFQLAEADFSDSVTLLARRGALALQQGQVVEAAKIADLVAQADPKNEVGKMLRNATGRLEVRQVSQQADGDSPEPPMPEEPHVAPNPGASLLEDQRQFILLQTQKLKNEVSNAIEASRNLTDPDEGLAALKQTLGAVKSAIDIAPEDRQRMQKQLDSEIQQLSNRKELLEQSRTTALEKRAQQEALKRLAEQASLDEERLENLIDRVRTLMMEGRHGRDGAYAEAQEVADVAINMRPGEGSSTAARFDAESAQQLNRAFRLRARRDDQLLETLHQVELSHIPFPDEPPLRFPPAEVWKALSERRKATATVDLKKNTPNEKRIQKALSETTEVSFTDNPLEEALNYLEDLHHIEIWLDKAALSDEGVNSDQQINLVMSGISLRSALRLMLEPLGLTYLIEDEVMKITTQAKADEKMSTRVYPVADLVIPIQPPMGMGGMGGLGGGMGGFGGGGGGMGGGMGGMGGMGGGMGGMGGMGGGGMGMFSIPPEAVAPKAQAIPIDADEVLKKKQ